MMKKRIDISIADVSEAYAGPVGTLWELVMGEEIHVGGRTATRKQAVLAGIRKDDRVLDICSALGGPARHLAAEFGCRVTGIDATPAMVKEAVRRTGKDFPDGRVTFRLGNALDLPFRGSSFDTVWGQDAWCYITDKARLIREAGRVTNPGGTIAFTDWIQLKEVPDRRLDPLLSFMLFPYLETLEGYPRLLEENGWEVTAADDLSRDFAEQFTMYRTMIQGELQPEIIRQSGDSFFSAVEEGITLWENAAHEGIVGRGLWIARKTGT
jgi:ubiquinone/menaquinone biosynthesis C-methylase UbiE